MPIRFDQISTRGLTEGMTYGSSDVITGSRLRRVKLTFVGLIPDNHRRESDIGSIDYRATTID